jgi:uncharacterized membrane protein YcaP (DUF421 family)
LNSMQRHISLTDWHRLLVGESGWSFLLQVVLRAALTYLLLMVAMRFLGKRVAAQLTLFELSIIVTLAATIGLPLQASDRGMLPALVVLAAAVLLQRTLALASLKKPKVEWLVAGSTGLLMEDGRMLLPALGAAALPRERVFAALRSQQVWQLGQVHRLYLEPSGDFTLVRENAPQPGLSLIPENDAELRRSMVVPGWFACGSCGHTKRGESAPREPCEYCRARQWTEAVGAELD